MDPSPPPPVTHLRSQFTTIPRSSSASTLSPSSSAAISQSLSSILNNPRSSDPTSSWWWPTSNSAPAPDFSSTTPLLPSTPFPEITRSQFLPYLSSISDSFARFEDVLHHSSHESDPRHVSQGGDALVACLREVPSLFFKEDFSLEEGPTFLSACPFSPNAEDNLALQERLTQYLDVVEMHLVREIALRSDSFFEAQGQLQGLNGQIVEACVRIRELKAGIRVLSGDLVGTAKGVQELNATRGNLVALQQKLTVILYVSQALSALKLLVSAADCSGALDVIDDLQHLLDADELVGLHCFRHLRDQLAGSLDSVNSILSAEFLRAAIHDGRAVDAMALLKFRTKGADLVNGAVDEVKLDDEESSNLRDRLLPFIVGLLRTAKLPAVLRLYRDTLITEMKAAIKATVAELLPVLLARSVDSELVTGDRAIDSDGGGLSLASKLRSLSSESFVQLLAAIFKVVQAHLIRASEVKKILEWVMGNIDGYANDSVAAAIANAATITASGEVAQDADSTVNSQTYSASRNTAKISMFQAKSNDSSSPVTSKNFRADVLRENTEAVFAACDAAHGRWAKLLGVRALIHPKLRLQEFLSIYDITQDFISATEKVGGRLGYSIRGTLQSQSKAFVDFQHDSRMAKIKAVLDQETWVAVDVPSEFQAIVVALSSDDAQIRITEVVPSDSGSQMNDSIEHTADPGEENKSLATNGSKRENQEPVPHHNEDNNMPKNGKATSQTLVYGGVGYHMVNCGLILLKMLSEYVDISKFLPALSSEVVHRVAEILKLFNTRTCQLVLGAGAMQVSGLKSITSKHLALASQIISFVYAILPDIRQVLFMKIPDARKSLLMAEIDRVAQDYKIHRDEIHTKLIQIMRERLLANLRKLPQIVESWNGPEDNEGQASQFARSVTKEVTYLHRILSQILLEVDVLAIFSQVVQIFHSHISEAFSKLEVNTPQAKNRLSRDVQHILACIRKLPSNYSSKDGIPNYGLLDEFLEEKFGVEVQ